MTQVSNIYDAYVSMIASQLPTYKRITNPYEPTQNAGLLLQKGYGIGIGPAENTERIITCKVSIVRTFEILLINQINTTENNISAKATIEKTIMEDLFKLIKQVDKDPSLQQTSIKSSYVSDNGLEYLEAEKAKFYLVRATFDSEYLEDTA